MGLKIGRNINFRPFLVFSSVFGRDTVFWSQPSFLVATQFFLVVTACLVATVSGQQLVFLLQLVDAITSSF